MAANNISLKEIAFNIEFINPFPFGPAGCPLSMLENMYLQDVLLRVRAEHGTIRAVCEGVTDNEVCRYCRFKER